MRRLAATIAVSASLMSASMAQDVPNLGVEGAGTSTQTLSLVKEAVTVTVDSGGSFSTLTGQGDGHLSVDVNGVGVGLGSGGSGSPGNPGSAVPPVGSGANAGVGSAGPVAPGPTGTNGDVGAISSNGLTAALASNCTGGAPLSPAAISQLRAGTRVVITERCEPTTVSDVQRQALVDNATLSRYLLSIGVDPTEISSITAFDDYVIVAR